MRRLATNIATSLTLSAALALWGVPADAQDFVWDPERPDARAPASVVGDAVLPAGAVTVAYRLVHLEMAGLRFEGERQGFGGGFELRPEDVIDFFSVVPLTRSRQVHELEVAFGVSENVTLVGRLPWIQNDAERLFLLDGDDGAELRTLASTSDGFGDPSLLALIGLWGAGDIRSHLIAGFSFPVADFDEADPLPTPSEAILPFAMQLGSGTWDFLPGVNLTAMNEVGTVGLQALATIRLGQTTGGWNLGNRLEGKLWMAPRVNDYLSASLGVSSSWWENVRVDELDLTDPIDPRLFDISMIPFFQGGMRWDVPVGVNVFFPERSLLHGLRVAAEAIVPVHHDVDGIQLGMDWGAALTVRWDLGPVVPR